MQNARSGPTLLSNDFKLKHSVLVGIGHPDHFSTEVVQTLFEQPKEISFGLVCLDGDTNSPLVKCNISLEEQTNLVENFKQHGLKAEFVKPLVHNTAELLEYSTIYDAFCVPKKIIKSNPEQVVFQLNCPMLLLDDNIQPIDNVLLLFDGTPECLLGIKRFIKLFYKWIQGARVTVFMLRNQSDDYIYKEKVMVNYLLSNFIDVGVITSHRDFLEQDLNKQIISAKSPLFMTGMYGAKAVFKKNLCKLTENKIPLFISTD